MATARTFVAAAAVVVGLSATAALAATDEYCEMILANQVVGRLRDPGKLGSLDARGRGVDQNIVQALSVEQVGQPRMWIDADGGTPRIYVGHTFLTDVLPRDAKGAGLTVRALARQWLAAFKRLFPLAEPVTHLKASSSGASSAASSTTPSSAAPKCITVPAVDRDLVSAMEQQLGEARGLPNSEFEAGSAELAARLVDLVRSKSSGDPTTPLPEAKGADKARASALNGLKYARTLADSALKSEQTKMALVLLTRVRTALEITAPSPPVTLEVTPTLPAPGG